MSLWSEIKQRRITQIVITYLMGGWAVLVVVDQVVDREVLPPVVYQVVLALYLIGILAAFVIGWYHGEKGEQKAPAIEIALLTVIGLAAIGTSGTIIRSSLNEASLSEAVEGGGLRSLAVLYLEDVSQDGSLQAVADGVTEGLITSLSTVRELDVRSRNGSREARSLGDVEPDSIARVLDVGALVRGTLDQTDDEIRVSIELLEGAAGIEIYRDRFAWPTSDVANVGTDLAGELALALREQIGVEIRLREGREAAPNPAAWLHVARAERFIKDAEEAIRAQEPGDAWDAFQAAEDELVAATEAAPDWAEPLTLRSRVWYERYVFAQDLEDFLATMGAAVEHAEAALRVDPANAGALEWRGTALYRRWLLGGEDEEVRGELLERAQEDLERALDLDRTRASVSSTLSHLYHQVQDPFQAVVAAREAYEQDAFLDVAADVLWRLITAYYDLDQHEQVVETCDRGRDRFSLHYRFVQCELLAMTMPAADADIDRAWDAYDRLLPRLTERRDLLDAQAQVMVAGVIGRAGLADSANAVFDRARVGSDVDDTGEVLVMEAAMRAVMGDVDGSLRALERLVVQHEDSAPGQHWWWRNVESHPDFQRLRSVH